MRGLGTTVLNAALAVVVAYIGVQSSMEAHSWRDGELFFEPGVIAIGVAALALSALGFALGLAAVLRRGQPASFSLKAWAVVTTVLAAMASGLWLFLVFVSAASD